VPVEGREKTEGNACAECGRERWADSGESWKLHYVCFPADTEFEEERERSAKGLWKLHRIFFSPLALGTLEMQIAAAREQKRREIGALCLCLVPFFPRGCSARGMREEGPICKKETEKATEGRREIGIARIYDERSPSPLLTPPSPGVSCDRCLCWLLVGEISSGGESGDDFFR
jgi:hypothetical protein